MQFVNSVHKLQSHHRDAIITIGNFDGVHLGHQQLITRLKQVAAKQQKASMIITFEPLPAEYFATSSSLPRLMALREKLHQFKKFEIDYVLCLKFNRQLADLPAQTFIDELLIKRLKIAHLIVGEDFRFGHGRQGDITLLKQQKPFTVDVLKKMWQEDACISSTRIRALLSNHHFDLASQLLGNPYTISGRVIPGQKLARTLGFPTANINLQGRTPPIQGVFAVEIAGVEAGKLLPGIANIGQKPTVNGVKKLLEVHLFDFDQVIYGQRLCIIPRKKIRDEKKFAGLTELSTQIAEDIKVAKQFFLQVEVG